MSKPEHQPSNPLSAPALIAGWGRIGRPGRLVESSSLEADSTSANLFRGLGRSYGDSAVPARESDRVVATPRADRLLFFDRERGILRAEAGVSLKTLNDLFLAERWFVPVSPGTQFVTLGGMVAADVHGKNHHVAGTFGRYVRALLLRTADGRLVECRPDCQPDLFWATVGGMGLTGHILEVECVMERIPSPWIWCESRRIESLRDFVVALKEAARSWPYTAGWIDCLTRNQHMGRGMLICGRWADPSEAPPGPPRPKPSLPIPFDFPECALARPVVRTFNSLIFHTHIPRIKRRIMHPAKFFYPLDTLSHWNRMYGRRGFTQYQCLLPEQGDGAATLPFFQRLTELGGSSFLCVIKDCGPEGQGMLSFPGPGISIALDLPVRDHTGTLVAELNRLVVALGGRIYLAKDQFTTAEDFRAMEPRLDRWLAVRRTWDPEGRIRSAQSVRLMGDTA
jgi:FAD/FMN-containing dehydrogenase